MKDFFSTKCNDLTVGQTLGFTVIVSLLSLAPLAIGWIAEEIKERRNYEED